DMNNVYVHISKGNNPGADRWITASADRLSNNGTAYIDFEFLQKRLTNNVQTGGTKPPCGGFTSAGTQGGRTVGDILVTAQYGSGGSLGTILTYRWEETPPLSGVFQYVEHTSNIPAGAAYVATSLVPGPLDGGHPPGPGIPVPYGAFGDPLYAYSQNQFVEVSIDLATVIGALAGDSCTGIQVSTVMIKTKTSTATNATQEDLIEPIQVSFTAGFEPVATASPAPCSGGTGSVSASWDGGTGPFECQLDSGSFASCTSPVTYNSVGAGSHTVTVKDDGNPGCERTSNSVTVTTPAAVTASSSNTPILCHGGSST